MKNPLWFIILSLMIVWPVVAQTESDVPPPLAFSNYDTDLQEYYVVDFATNEVTTIPRAEGYFNPEFGGGETIIPYEVNLQSPYNPAEQVQFLNESNAMLEEDGYYTLYRLSTNGQRDPIIDHAWPSSPLEWSPNGQYLYFSVSLDKKNYTLYQYDLGPAQTLIPLYESPSWLQFSCDRDRQWCVFRHFLDPDKYGELSLLLINTNTGAIQPIATISSTPLWVWWQEQRSGFLYETRQSEQERAVHFYNYADHADTLIAEINSEFAMTNMLLSPDNRWLAVASEDVFVIDMLDLSAEALLASDSIDLPVDPSSLQWVSSDKLYFEALYDDYKNTEIHGYYVTSLPDGETRTAGEFEILTAFIDQEWSADGRWVAVAFSNSENSTLYVVDVLGESLARQVELNFPADKVICVGWYEPEVYAGGEAYLCDIYMGIG